MTRYLFTLLLFISMPSMADEDQLLELLRSIQSSPQNLNEAIHAGGERALLCKYCHGVDGNSKKDTIPNLAAQNPEYLIHQFELFARGERTNKTMNELAKLLSSEDKVNIALFFSAQQVKSQEPYKSELVETGRKLFNTRCFFCHGKDAHGKDTLPRISSQPPAYVIRTLKSYSASQAKRAETAMSRIGRSLETDEIEALAAYLTTLK